MTPLSWKPELRGAIYCAPACGFNCTKAAYEEAHRKAAKLAHRLGPDWKVRVWENLGWHYSVGMRGKDWNIQVYPPRLPGEGSSHWIDLHISERQFHVHAKTARAGIRLVLREARKAAHAFNLAAMALPEFL